MSYGLYGPVPSREYSFDSRYGEAQPVLDEIGDVESPTAYGIVPPLFQFSNSLRENVQELERRPSRRVSINQGRETLSGKAGKPQKIRTYDLVIQKLVYKVWTRSCTLHPCNKLCL